MKYDKIIKWVLVGLFVVGVILSFLGFAIGFEKAGNAPVDVMLYCAYAYALIAILAVLFGGGKGGCLTAVIGTTTKDHIIFMNTHI